MPNGEEKLNLSDLVDVNFLQRLQDTFANTMGVASLIVDEHGPITNPSNFSDFCNCFQQCCDCNIEFKNSLESETIDINSDCHLGLTRFMVPIIVANQHIASIYCGQFALEHPNEHHLSNLAKKLGIDDKKYLKSLKQIKILSPENVKTASDLLLTISETIAEMANRTLELTEERNKESFHREIIEVIRSSLDINEALFLICEATARFFNVQRASVSEAPPSREIKRPTVKMEYKTIPDMEGINKLLHFDKIAEYYFKIVEKGEMVVIDNIYESDAPDFFKESYIALGVKSLLAITIQKEEKWGILILSEYNNYRHWSDDEIEIAKSIANQIYMAIKHAESYEQEKKTAARENLLRRITETIRSSLDINEIKNAIVKETCEALGGNRCFIIEYKKSEDRFLPVTNEYMNLDNIKSSVGFDLSKEAQELEEMNRAGKEVTLPDVDKFLDENRLRNSLTEKHFQKYDVKSGFSIPLYYQDDWLGLLVIHFTTKQKTFDKEEIELIRTLASQIAIALHQAELYEKEKATSAKEIALRDTVKIIRSSLNTEEIKSYFLEVACNYFNADRCIFDNYDKETKKFLPFEIELVRSEGIKSLINVSVEEYFPEFAEKLKSKKRNIIIKDVEKTLARKKFPNYKALQTLQYSDAKSDYGLIVQHKDDIIGILILHYVKNKRILNSEELEFLKILRDQVGIALHQAELYEKEKKTAEREALLRRITEKIRSSLNIEETLSFICEETAKIFNVQRTAISSFPNPENYEIFTIRKEYKYWENMEGFGFKPEAPKAAAHWASILLEGEGVLAFDNIESSDAPDYFKKLYSSMGVKSVIGISIKKGKDAWGTLVLSEYNKYRRWGEEEKNLLKTIADQIYIAINQAELFEKSEKKAQNERALREIMLTSVQTFDMPKMIKSLVTEAGKLFSADRCFFIEVDTETNTNLPIQDYAEYRSSEDIVSHTTRPPSKQETSNFIQRTREKKYEYSADVLNSPIPEATKKMLVEDLGVKSYLIAPVFYGDICYGAFVFHYVLHHMQFSQDEIDMAIAIANQSAVILHQAELFELTKMQTEREKISKNIIEILRSTLDRSIIKRLFVKNIGQFLNADRVMLSEFNEETQNYSPVGVDSEYLSGPDIKSFVGYDWTNPQAQEYIRPILEKREFHIYNWYEFIQGAYVGHDFIDLFESMNVKSSYSFPVMYQQNIMGFFSIGFVQKVRRLSDEDVNRIRNICTQAGIALYHSHLYEEAQKSVQKHNEFINKLSSELKDPLNMIAEFSGLPSEHEIECSEEVEHLNQINDNAKKLIYFLEDITKSINKLNLE